MIYPGEEVIYTMKTMHMVAYLLLFAGGLNWGLVGLFNFNLVEALLGAWPALVMLVYILVGVSTVWIALMHKNDCKICSK
jgi:uncharacterized membrane protein YuzA (DUF378 family)